MFSVNTMQTNDKATHITCIAEYIKPTTHPSPRLDNGYFFLQLGAWEHQAQYNEESSLQVTSQDNDDLADLRNFV